jgi:hypothetical protein
LNGARALERDHATIARTYEMIEKTVEDPKNHLAKAYPDRRFLVAIRLPGCSINTEKSYLDWIIATFVFTILGIPVTAMNRKLPPF